MDIFSPFEEYQDQLSPNRNITPLTAALDQEKRLVVASSRSLSKILKLFAALGIFVIIGQCQFILDEERKKAL